MPKEDVLTLLARCPGHLEVFLGGMPVTGVEVAVDIASDEEGDASQGAVRADDVVAMPSILRRGPTGRLRCLKVRNLIMLLSCWTEATGFIIGGRGIDGVRIRAGRVVNDGNRRRFEPDAVGGRDVVLTFTRLMDFSDGSRHLVPL